MTLSESENKNGYMKKDAIKRNVDWIYEPAAVRQRNSFGPAQATPPPTWPAVVSVCLCVCFVFLHWEPSWTNASVERGRETGHKLLVSATVAAHSEAKRS